MHALAKPAASSQQPAAWVGHRTAVFALGGLALLLAALPYAGGFLDARRGSVFLGALNNLGDIGQYLAALRQGMEGHVLYINQYTSLHVPPVLIYPLYTTAGLLLGPLRLSPHAAYYLVHVAAAVALLVALWQFCTAVLPARPILSYAIALFGGGLYLPVLLLSGVVRLPFAPVSLTAPELSVFTTLMISPHGTLGLAAELWGLTGYLCWRLDGDRHHLVALALGGLILGLSYPFGLPVLLAITGADTLGRYVWLVQPGAKAITRVGVSEASDCGAGGACDCGRMANHADCGRETISERAGSPLGSTRPWHCSARRLPSGVPAGEGSRRLLAPQCPSFAMRLQSQVCSDLVLAPAIIPAFAVALYYAVLFGHDPDWGASNLLRLPPPGLAVLAAAFGLVIALALPSMVRAIAGRTDLTPPPPLHRRGEGAHVATASPPHAQVGWVPTQWEGCIRPSGVRAYRLLATWAIVNPLLLLAPLPQSGRLVSGWSIPLALLAAATLTRMRARSARRWAIALSLSNVTLALLYLTVTLSAGNAAYYEPAGQAAAVSWLATHATTHDVVMASAGSGNLVVSAARCRVVVGQNFETFHWAQAQTDVLRYYAAGTPAAERRAILRRHGVTLVLDGPYERALGHFTPATSHGYRLVYAGGAVDVYAVEAG